MRFRVLACILALTASVGCERCKGAPEEVVEVTPPTTTTNETENTQAPGSGRPAVFDRAHFGRVTGFIRLASEDELPLYRDADVRDPSLPEPPEACTPPQSADRRPVVMDDARGLAGVMVAGTIQTTNDSALARTRSEAFGEHFPELGPVTHDLRIVDCRLQPMFLPVMRGDVIRLQNDTDFAYIPTFGDSRFQQALLQGQSRDIPIERGGVGVIKCVFSGACGRTDVPVTYNPVFTVSTEGGRFVLENVPTGQVVELHAWHPLFHDVSAEVEVEAGGTSEVEIVIRAAPLPAIPAQPERPEGPAENRPGLF